MKSIDEQIIAMREWPEFDLKHREDRGAVWEGDLFPVKRRHRVRMLFQVPLAVERFNLRDIQPLVQVMDPLLEQHDDYDEGPVPHVYWTKRFPEMPYLCLFSPSGGEWTPHDLLSRTTVFWTCEWLYFYEGWLVTKKWLGGGRHPLSDQGPKRLEAV